MPRFRPGQSVAFRGREGVVEAVDLTPGMVDVRYGPLVKRHKAGEVSPLARTNRGRRPRKARKGRKGATQRARFNPDWFVQRGRDLIERQEKKAAQKGLPLDPGVQKVKELVNDLEVITHALDTIVAGRKVPASSPVAGMPLAELRGAGAEVSKALVAAMGPYRYKSSMPPGPGGTAEARPPQRPQKVAKAAASSVTKKQQESLFRSQSGPYAAQLAREGAAWVVLPDPPRFDGPYGAKEFCGNAMDGLLYAVVVNKGVRTISVVVTRATVKEAVVAYASAKGLTDLSSISPREALEFAKKDGKIRTNGPFMEMGFRTREFGMRPRHLPAEPARALTRQEVEAIQRGEVLQASLQRGRKGTAKSKSFEMERTFLPRETFFYEKEPGKYYYLAYRLMRPASLKLFEQYMSPYLGGSKKRKSPYFSWVTMERPLDVEKDAYFSPPFCLTGDERAVLSEAKWFKKSLMGLRNALQETDRFLSQRDDMGRDLVEATKRIRALLGSVSWTASNFQPHLIALGSLPPDSIAQSPELALLEAFTSHLPVKPGLNLGLFQSLPLFRPALVQPNKEREVRLIGQAGLSRGREVDYRKKASREDQYYRLSRVPEDTLAARITATLDAAGTQAWKTAQKMRLTRDELKKHASLAERQVGHVVGAKKKALLDLVMSNIRLTGYAAPTDPRAGRQLMAHIDAAVDPPAVEGRRLFLQVKLAEIRERAAKGSPASNDSSLAIQIEDRLAGLNAGKEAKERSILRALIYTYYSLAPYSLLPQLDAALATIKQIISNGGKLSPGGSASMYELEAVIRRLKREKERAERAAPLSRSDLAEMEKEALSRLNEAEVGSKSRKEIKAVLKEIEGKRLELGANDKRIVKLRTDLEHAEMRRRALSTGIAPADFIGGMGAKAISVEVFYTFNTALFEITRRRWKGREKLIGEATHEEPMWDKTSRKRLPDLKEQQRAMFTRIDQIGRYGTALELLYSHAAEGGDMEALAYRLERSLGIEGLLDKLAPLDPGDRAGVREAAGEIETDYPNIARVERGRGYDSFIQDYDDPANLTSASLSEAPMATIQTLKDQALRAMAAQRREEGQRARRRRGKVSETEMDPLRFREEGPFRSTGALGLSQPHSSFMPPHSSVAALEHLEDDAASLLDVIQERKAHLRENDS